MIKITSVKQFQTVLKKHAKQLIVIDFYAKWCSPCKKIEPVFIELSKKYKNVVFLKIDVDDISLNDLCEDYNVEQIPTFKFICCSKVNTLTGSSNNNLEKEIIKRVP